MKQGDTITFNGRMSERYAWSLMMMLVMIVFIASYGQLPLYTSNQNTYFLHGLADGGFGFLVDDWLANTADPFPVFSWLVRQTYTYLSESFFYFYQCLLLGVFIWSVMGIVGKIWGINRSRTEYLTCSILVSIMWAASLAYVAERGTGINLRQIFVDGLAGQYLLGPGLQPSVFGVFLPLSIYAFVCNRPFWAVCGLAVAANMHATYLFSAALLTVAYMASLALADKKPAKALWLGIFSLLLVSPVVWRSYVAFAATSPDMLAWAREILVNEIFPEHAKLGFWFDITSLIQILIMIAGLAVSRRSKRLWLIMLISFFAGFLLTVAQLVTDSNVLALLFPWRVSTFLFPLSVCLLISGAVSFFFHRYSAAMVTHQKAVNHLLAAALTLLLLTGIGGIYLKFHKHDNQDFLPMMDFVAAMKAKGDVYLTPLAMDRFRLRTGAPILVDRKSHPYKDIEVLAWHDRMQDAKAFFEESGKERCEVLRKLSKKYKITHVVNDTPISGCPTLRRIYADDKYFIYKIETVASVMTESR